MEIESRLKTALDESRLLILGAQVLFGFQFEAVFQERRNSNADGSARHHSRRAAAARLAIDRDTPVRRHSYGIRHS